jgi:hypothetical protein
MPIGNWPLDANQVIQSVYDTTENALRVNTQATITAGAMEVAIDASTDSIKVSDGTDVLEINPDGSINVVTTLSPSSSSVLIYGFDGLLNQKVKVDAAGELQVDVLSSALPTGAATETTLALINGKITVVDTSNTTITSSVLPTGASTSALQITGNASLVSIDSKLTSPLSVTGPLTDVQLRASPVPVSGTVSITGVATEAKQDVGNISLASIDAKLTAPLIVDGSGVTQPISASTLPLPTGASTLALQTSGNASLVSIDSKLTAPLSVTGPLTNTELRATPVPISGTVTANLGTIAGVSTEVTLSALNTKVPSNLTVTSTRLLVDGSGVTQPISAASLPLPSGASTAALQTTGNASLASIDSKLTNPLPISGTVTANAGTNLNTSLLALESGGNLASIKTDVDNLNLAQGSTTSGQKGNLGLAAVTTAAPSYTTGQTSPLSLTTSGSLRVDFSGSSAGTVNQGTANTIVNAWPIKLTDGIDTTAVVPASTAAVATDPAVVVALSPNSPLPSGTNNIGTVNAVSVDNPAATYSASAVAFVPAAAATDVFVIKGSASKTIKITRVEFAVTTTAGSGGLISAQLIKRSTANTGGTSVTNTATPHDSNNAAATAVVTHYTANPATVGTAVGTLRAIRAEAYNTGIAPTYTIWDFGNRPGQAIYLRGVNEFVTLNFGGATITGPIACINIEWTEA